MYIKQKKDHTVPLSYCITSTVCVAFYQYTGICLKFMKNFSCKCWHFLSNLIFSGFLKELLTHQTLFTVLKNYLLFQWSVCLHLAILKAFNLRYFEKINLN